VHGDLGYFKSHYGLLKASIWARSGPRSSGPAQRARFLLREMVEACIKKQYHHFLKKTQEDRFCRHFSIF
jgi:hypothetical protein